jgi:hypothetical protein
MLQGDLVHLADDVLGAVERRRVGELREADEVLLVLARHEADGTFWNSTTVRPTRPA